MSVAYGLSGRGRQQCAYGRTRPGPSPIGEARRGHRGTVGRRPGGGVVAGRVAAGQMWVGAAGCERRGRQRRLARAGAHRPPREVGCGVRAGVRGEVRGEGRATAGDGQGAATAGLARLRAREREEWGACSHRGVGTGQRDSWGRTRTSSAWEQTGGGVRRGGACSGEVVRRGGGWGRATRWR